MLIRYSVLASKPHKKLEKIASIREYRDVSESNTFLGTVTKGATKQCVFLLTKILNGESTQVLT